MFIELPIDGSSEIVNTDAIKRIVPRGEFVEIYFLGGDAWEIDMQDAHGALERQVNSQIYDVPLHKITSALRLYGRSVFSLVPEEDDGA